MLTIIGLPILPFSFMEDLFKSAIVFAFPVSNKHTNEFFKTKLTTNSAFFIFVPAVCPQVVSQLLRNLLNNRGDKEPILPPDG